MRGRCGKAATWKSSTGGALHDGGDESSLFNAASAKKCAERKAAERLQTAEVVGGGPKDLQRRRVAGGSE